MSSLTPYQTPPEAETLLERTAAGLTVTVGFDGRAAWLHCSTDAGSLLVAVSPSAMLDAFDHPALYCDLAALLAAGGQS